MARFWMHVAPRTVMMSVHMSHATQDCPHVCAHMPHATLSCHFSTTKLGSAEEPSLCGLNLALHLAQ